uniref:Ly-6 neurotoxin superfamily member 1 n=1 Tax=Triatoma infestans TaxID=30076 RepID=A0A170ZNA1_TRIIF
MFVFSSTADHSAGILFNMQHRSVQWCIYKYTNCTNNISHNDPIVIKHNSSSLIIYRYK